MARAALIAIAISLFASPALADSQSLFTIGVGTEMGVNRHSPIEGGTQRSFVSELTVRLRMLKVLGVSFAYNLADVQPTGELSFTSRYRLSGLVYVVPTDTLSFYLSGGLGARDISHLGTVQGSTNTYHAGAGLELYLGDHFAVHVDYMWIIPGASSISGSVERRASEDIDATVAGYESAGVIPTQVEMATDISAGDYLDPGNFQLNVGLRWYL